MSTAPGRRAAQAAAVAFGVFTLAVGLASVPLDQMARQPGPNGSFSLAFTVAVMVPAVAVGTLLAARRPRNPIGWLLLAVFLLGVAPRGRLRDHRLPDASRDAAARLGRCRAADRWPVWLVLIAIMVWVFPDGLLPAGRWRPGGESPGDRRGGCWPWPPRLRAPPPSPGTLLSSMPPATSSITTTGLTAALQGFTAIGVLISLLVWAAVQVPRYRRADDERRQQLKWLYSGAVVFVASLFLAVMTNDSGSAWSLAVNDVISPVGFAVLPFCVGVAVLKYRLYAIDRIISRVISYAVLSAVLAGVFAGLVLLATQVLPFHTPVGVAVATLAAAALFNPLRRRVQRGVDRRFNRSRYNAEAVIAAFTQKLRGTVDLDAVRDDLAAAVDQAFEPVHVSVWLPGPGRAR